MSEEPAIRPERRNLLTGAWVAQRRGHVAMGDEKLGELYGGVLGLPVTFLIDSHGQVRAEYRGETDLNTIERQLKPLLLSPSR